jgi:hypothetical protein
MNQDFSGTDSRIEFVQSRERQGLVHHHGRASKLTVVVAVGWPD